MYTNELYKIFNEIDYRPNEIAENINKKSGIDKNTIKSVLSEFAFLFNPDSGSIEDLILDIWNSLDQYRDSVLETIKERIQSEIDIYIEERKKRSFWVESGIISDGLEFHYQNSEIEAKYKLFIDDNYDDIICSDILEFEYHELYSPFAYTPRNIEYTIPIGEIEIQWPSDLKLDFEIPADDLNRECDFMVKNDYIYYNTDYDLVSFSINIEKLDMMIERYK